MSCCEEAPVSFVRYTHSEQRPTKKPRQVAGLLGSSESRAYQRGRPPPPPPVRGLSTAMLTLSGRPPRSLPFCSSAFSADCWLAKVTKPKPLGRPVSRSMIRANSEISPYWEKIPRNWDSSTEKGRLPTYNLFCCDISIS